MSKHATYNESNTTEGKSIAAWYMTEGSQRMLVVHNLSGSDVEISLAKDDIKKIVGKQGAVYVKKGDDKQYRMGAYSSIVFLL